MNISSNSLTKLGTRRQKAIALITVISMVAIMTVFTVALLSMAKTESVTANSNSDAERARQYAEMATNIVMGQIWAGTKQTGGGASRQIWASQPGAIRKYNNNGTFNSGYRLYSSSQMVVTGAENQMISDSPPPTWGTETSRYTDLNEPIVKPNVAGAPTAPPRVYFPIVDPRAYVPAMEGTVDGPNVEGFWYDQSFGGVVPAANVGDTGSRLPMPVEWLYVLKSGAVGTLGAGNTFTSAAGGGVGTPSADNPIVGRIAFWTDDESCKLNINTAGEPTNWSVPTYFHTRDQSWAFNQPTSFEYQRYPGHPASVALSTVLYPNRELDAYALRQNQTLSQAAIDWKEKIYRIMPKLGEGGSKAGTVPFWKFVKLDTTGDGVVDNSPESNINIASSIQERLYASVDELLFSDDIVGNTRTMHTVGNPNNNILFETPAQLERARFFLTAHSRMPEVTMFGTPRVAIWPVADRSIPNFEQYRTGYDQLIAFCASLGRVPTGTSAGNAYYFTRKDSQSPVTDVTLPRNAQLLAYLNSLMGRTYPGSGSASFATKYGTDTNQILINIFDYIRSTNLYDGFLSPTREQILQPGSIYAMDNTTRYGNGPGETHNQGTLHRNKPTGYKTYTPDRGSRSHTESSDSDTTERERVADRAFPGHGQVVPSSYQNGTYRGIGRFPTLSEFGFQFICTADGNCDKGSFRNPVAGVTPAYISAADADAKANNSISGGRTAVRIDPHDWGLNGSGSGTRYQENNEDQFWYSNFPPYPPTSAYGTTGGRVNKLINGQMRSIVHPGFNPRNWNITLDPATPLQPGQRRVQAMLQFEFTIPSAGFTKINPEFSVVVRGPGNGLETISINGNPLFDTGQAGRLIWKSNMEVFDANGCRSLGASISTAAMTAGRRVRAPSQALSAVADPGYDTVASASGEVHRGLLNFDLTSRFVTVTGSTMTFTGGPLIVEMWAGHDLTQPEMMVQQINLPVPATQNLPVPQLVTISSDHRRVQDSQGRYTERKAVEAPRWWIMSWGGAINRWTGSWPGTPVVITPAMNTNSISAGNNPGSRVLGRFADWGGNDDNFAGLGIPSDGTIFAHDRNSGNYNSGLTRQVSPAADVPNDLFSDTGYSDRQPGVDAGTRDPRGADVLFTLVPVHGDVRQIASKRVVPASDWMVHPKTIQLNNPTNLGLEHNFLAHNLSRYNTDSDPGFDRGVNANFRLVPNVLYAGSKIPDLPNHLATLNVAKRYGDFDNGVGGLRDGAWVNKPDEGNSLITYQRMDQDQIRRMVGAYFYDPDDLQTSEDMGSSYNTPNRLLPSPGVFGSLPAVVKTGSGDPWRTLLFRPYTPRNLIGGGSSTHPGSRSDAPWGGTDPADHYLLDLFWMPVVEPYAISEPFSTAGKVNINYQMVPFSHIRRATGIHAVMKGEILAAVPSADAGGGEINQGFGRYKSQPVNASNASYQANTLDQNENDRAYYWMMWRDVADRGNQSWDQSYASRFANKYWHRKILTEQRSSAASSTVQGTLLQFENRFKFLNSTEAPTASHGLFRTASQICEIHLIPQKIPSTNIRDGGDAQPAVPYNVASMTTFWQSRGITGDNTRERPYTNIYGKITTQSNTFTVHMRAQSIRKAKRSVAANTIDFERDTVVGDFRGSAIIERRIDPSDASIPDYAANPAAPPLDNFYRFRVLQLKRFNP